MSNENKLPGKGETHNILISQFVDYLIKEGFKDYVTELAIPGTNKLKWADVAVFNHRKMFIFEMKSSVHDIANDIQQLKECMMLLKKHKRYHWRDMSGYLVYNDRSAVERFKNIFKNVGVFIVENGSIQDINNRELKDEIKTVSKLSRFMMALRIFATAPDD